MEKILAGKDAERKRLVSLPYEEKLALLEKMRDRGLLIKNSKTGQSSEDKAAAGSRKFPTADG
jgi:hypothetical protein